MAHQNPSTEALRRILSEARTVAVVGASGSQGKAAHHIPEQLQQAGFRIVPINPREQTLFGQPVRRSLDEVPPGSVDIVDVFRPAEEAPGIAEQAIRVGARVLWLQLGIVSEEAARRAEAAGLTVVMDKCLGATWRQLGLPPKAP